MISSIYRQANSDPPTGADAENRNAVMYQRAWQERGLFIVNPDSIADEWVRQVIINEAEKRYLKRTSR